MKSKKRSIELSLNTIAIVVLVLAVIIVSLFVFVPFFTKNAKKIKEDKPSTTIKNISDEIINEFN